MNVNPWPRCRIIVFALSLGLALPLVAAPLQLVSQMDPSYPAAVGGGGDSWQPIITPDGRYVLFASRANNLVLSGANSPFLNQSPPKLNVYRRDRTSGTTLLVSVNLSGTGPANGDSLPTGLSTNGQFALFESAASDLVPGDTNHATDIFLRDLVNGTNQLVSASTNGGFGNGTSWESALTPDGHYAVFASTANNLVPKDINGIQDVFVRDLQAGATTLASPGATASSTPSSSDAPRITPDGRYVAYRSSAIRLVYSSPSVVNEIYVRDMVAGVTTLASTNAHKFFPATPYSYNQVMSDDGQYVAFESSTMASAGVIQRFNVMSGFTDVIYTNAVAPLTYNHFRSVDMTPDGRYVTWIGNTNRGGSNCLIMVWDGLLGSTTVASTNLNGTVPTSGVADWPTLDASGRWVAFLCTATNLTTNVVAGDFHLFVHDLQAGITVLVDAGATGAGLAKAFLSAPSITPDGRWVAFDATDADLVTNDNNQAYDVFVGDWNAGMNELISVRQPTLPGQTPSAATLGPLYSVGTDGRYVAFAGTGAGLLAAGYTNAWRGVFVRDQLNGANVLASVDTNGLGGANGWSFEPSLSGDGQKVVFTSGANNLVAGDANGTQDVFLRDVANEVTTLVSMNATGTGSGNAASYSPTISTAGRYVLFHSKSSNLAAGTFNGGENLFLRDLQLTTNYALTTSTLGLSAVGMSPDLRFIAFGRSANNVVLWDSQAAAPVYTNVTSFSVTALAVSQDGNRFAYSLTGGFYAHDRAANSNWLIGPSLGTSRVALQFSGDSRYLVYATGVAEAANDTNTVADVYLYDFQTRSNLLISQSLYWPGAANGPSDSPQISADGRFIVYRSSASDVAAGATNGQPQIIIFDRQTGTPMVVSVSSFGSFSGNNRSLAPVFSGDGQTLVFQSWAADLVDLDFNQSASLYSLKLYTGNSSPPFLGQIIYVPASTQWPSLTWSATTGENYQVQFKNNLADPLWQNLNGTVRVIGNSASFIDYASGSGQRFYRIMAY